MSDPTADATALGQRVREARRCANVSGATWDNFVSADDLDALVALLTEHEDPDSNFAIAAFCRALRGEAR